MGEFIFSGESPISNSDTYITVRVGYLRVDSLRCSAVPVKLDWTSTNDYKRSWTERPKRICRPHLALRVLHGIGRSVIDTQGRPNIFASWILYVVLVGEINWHTCFRESNTQGRRDEMTRAEMSRYTHFAQCRTSGSVPCETGVQWNQQTFELRVF